MGKIGQSGATESQLALLLRYSGLRIRDAVTLARNRSQGDKLFLYTRQDRDGGILSITAYRHKSAERDSDEHVLLLDRNFKTEECRCRLTNAP